MDRILSIPSILGSSMQNPKKSPFDEHAKDVLLGAVIGALFGSAVCVFVAAIVGAIAYSIAGDDQVLSIFPVLSTSALTCVIVGAVLGARAGHYEGLGLSFTIIKGVLVGGSIGVIATLFAPIIVSVIIGSAVGVLSGFWFDR